MPERLLEKAELQPTEVITHALSDWLHTEIENSRHNNNAVLNEYDKSFRKSLLHPYGDSSSPNTQKAISHINRLEKFTDELFAVDDNDEASSLLFFGIMMGLSGATREQCFVIARNQTSYMNHRYGSNPLGLNVSSHVNERLRVLFGKQPDTSDLQYPTVTKDQIIANSHEINHMRDKLGRHQYRCKDIPDIQKPFLAVRWLELRKAWLDLAVDYTVYAAQRRGGDLSKVPMREAKTIATAELVYPLGHGAPYFRPDYELEAEAEAQSTLSR